jgi:hypothetical protein
MLIPKSSLMAKSRVAGSHRFARGFAWCVLASVFVPHRVPAQDTVRTWVATVQFVGGSLDIGVMTNGWIIIRGRPDHRDQLEYGPKLREWFAPADIERWVQQIAVAAANADNAFRSQSPKGEAPAKIGASPGAGFTVSVANGERDKLGRRLVFSVASGDCASRSTGQLGATWDQLLRLMAALRHAMAVSRSVPESQPLARGARPYWRHEVSCGAIVRNPHPLLYPAAVPANERRPRNLAVEFVVDDDGRPEVATMRTMPGSDPRFVAAARAQLGQWQFWPATVGGVLVAQLVDTLLVFDPDPTAAVPVIDVLARGSEPFYPARIFVAGDDDGWVRVSFTGIGDQFVGRPVGASHFQTIYEWYTPDAVERWSDSVYAAARDANAAEPNPGMKPSIYTAVLGMGSQLRLRVAFAQTGSGSIQTSWGLGGLCVPVPPVENIDPTFLLSMVPYDREHDSLVKTSLVRQFQMAAHDARSRSKLPMPSTGRVRDATDVSCPLYASADSSPVTDPPATGDGRFDADVFTAFVVDTTGRVDSATVRTMSGEDDRGTTLARRALADWRFKPAIWSGIRVPQLLNLPIFVEPQIPDGSSDSASEAARADSIFAALFPSVPWVQQLATSPRRRDSRVSHIPVPVRQPEVRYDVRAELEPLNERQVAADALGWPMLADAALPNGEKEIRIYKGSLIGYPHDGLRLVIRGHATSGTWIRYWPKDPASDSEAGETGLDSRLRGDERGRCSTFQVGRYAVACIVRFAHDPDWSALRRRLEAANVWDLPDQSALPNMNGMLDGWRVWVEVREGPNYRTYEYTNPQAIGLPQGDDAFHIMTVIDSLVPLARPSERLRGFRGFLLIRPGLANFTPCEGGSQWHLGGRLNRVRATLGDSAVQGVDRTTPTFYLEGVGAFAAAAPGGTPRAKGPDAVSVEGAADTLTVVRRARPGDCR